MIAYPEQREEIVELEDLVVRPGTYFNPQTEVVVIVDDSLLDRPGGLQHGGLRGRRLGPHLRGGAGRRERAGTRPSRSSRRTTTRARVVRSRRRRSSRPTTKRTRARTGRTPDERTRDGDGYTVATREEATDWMAEWPGFGEMRWYSEALGTEQVSFSWRSMPRGHRRPRKLRPSPPRPGGDLLRDLGHGDVQGRRRRVRGRAEDRGADDRRGVLLRAQRHRRRPRADPVLDRLAEPPTEKQEDFWPE